jgi:serine protease
VTSCSPNAQHIEYPKSSVLADVFYFPEQLEPDHDGNIPADDIAYAAWAVSSYVREYLDPDADRNSQYVILTPTGTHPDGFNNGADFCAWHSAIPIDRYTTPVKQGLARSIENFSKNVNLSLAQNQSIPNINLIAYTNAPYITDAGRGCGMGFVNGKTAA